MNDVAAQYLNKRWFKSRVARWDYRQARRVLLEELSPALGDQVLEIGCGPGTWTKEVAPLVRNVVAVDISPEMIEGAKEYTKGLRTGFVNADSLEADVEGRFDKIFSSRAIEYIADLDALAKKIGGLSKPGGRTVLITKTRFSLWRGRMRLVYRRERRSGEGGPIARQYLRSPGQLSEAFARYGFTTLRIRPVICRAPVFQEGYHEFPLVPDKVAAPFLALFQFLYSLSLRLPDRLMFLPLAMSETCCVTLQRTPAEDLPSARGLDTARG